MSYFRVALQRESEERGLNQTELGRRAGLSKSYVSRLLNGEEADLSDENFVAILKVCSSDPRAQAELVGARCMDVRVGPGSELVEIHIKGAQPSVVKSSLLRQEHSGGQTMEGKPSVSPSNQEKERTLRLPDVHLSQETERAFAWLRSQCPINADLEKHLVGYAKLTGMPVK
jgi:transcriptional regulator with XRE-family HTH domain